MKGLKKTLSLILCFIMVFAITVPAFAAAETVKYPTIYVPGIASSYIYEDVNDPTQRIDVIDKEAMMTVLKKEIVPALIVYAADGDADNLAHKISAAANDVFGSWFNNPDGTPVGNAGVVNKYPETISGNSRLVFSYDWRGDPFVLAAQLNEYIDYVIETSGIDKVALTSHSMGSIVILTYLSVYGDEKISGIVLDVPVIDGVAYVGDLLCGEAEVTTEAFATFFKSVMGATEYEELAASSLEILEMSEVPDLATGFIDEIFKKIGPVFFRETLVPMFGYWLTIWAMCPENKVDQAVDFVFGDATDEATLSLKEKIVNYNELVRKGRKDTLLKFDEHGRMAVIARYGYSALPVSASWDILGDSVVETKSNSLGATTAVVGNYFSDEYLDGKDMKYISPDKTVDASTCLFPDKTWFIKDLLHVEAGATTDIQKLLLSGEEEATCDNSALPRFMIYDFENQSFSADNSVPEKTEKPSPLQRLFNFLKALFEKIIDFFTRKK